MIFNDPPQQQAAEIIMHDLIECLFAERFFINAQQDLHSLEQLQIQCEQYPGLFNQISTWPLTTDIPQINTLFWRWWPAEDAFVVIPVKPGICHTLERVRHTPVYSVTLTDSPAGYEVSTVTPVALMKMVQKSLPEDMPGQPKGCELFIQTLADSLDQTAWSMEHNIRTDQLLQRSPAEAFQILEQWASVRDRPFHPTAKAKSGLDEVNYRRYMAEFDHRIPMQWVAIPLQLLEWGTGVDSPRQNTPANYILTDEQRETLHQEMVQRGIDQSHIAIPIHPWQLEHAIPRLLADEWQSCTCETLAFQDMESLATSSVRSMAPVTDSPHYLKLPMAIYSLGGSRYLPAVKMINGQRSEQLLRRALPLDKVLDEQVFLCDETKWWAYMPEGGSLFDEAPRHLSAMVRSYPEHLLQDFRYRMIPMAALGTLLSNQSDGPAERSETQHVFDHWMTYRQLEANNASVHQLFREVCHCFLNINLRTLRIGLLAEMHGQNAVLILKDGNVDGLLFRDHDSLRLFVPWLEDAGLADPEYCIRKGAANTLYHDAPEDLLFYLQTLGIQVNLRAIVETLSLHYGIEESSLWYTIKDVMSQLIEDIDFSDDARAMIKKQVFESKEWPLKLLIKPMIERAGGPGSMPFGKGTLQNPFHQLKCPETNA